MAHLSETIAAMGEKTNTLETIHLFACWNTSYTRDLQNEGLPRKKISLPSQLYVLQIKPTNRNNTRIHVPLVHSDVIQLHSQVGKLTRKIESLKKGKKPKLEKERERERASKRETDRAKQSTTKETAKETANRYREREKKKQKQNRESTWEREREKKKKQKINLKNIYIYRERERQRERGGGREKAKRKAAQKTKKKSEKTGKEWERNTTASTTSIPKQPSQIRATRNVDLELTQVRSPKIDLNHIVTYGNLQEKLRAKEI